MAETKYLGDDIVPIYAFNQPHNAKNWITTLYWGDSVQVLGQEGKQLKLDFSRRKWNLQTGKYEWEQRFGSLPSNTRFMERPILKVRFLDVGQGDASIIESPAGKLIIIDGGEGTQLRNYITAAWAHVFRTEPLEVEAIVVTHGDSDHCAGLTDLLKARRGARELLVNVHKVYHSGLVKGPDQLADTDIFGTSVDKDGKLYANGLVDDLTTSSAPMNTKFQAWKKALGKSAQNNADFCMRRLAYGDQNSFDFLDNEGIAVQVLGPIAEEVGGKAALPFLHKGKSYSASHTINGHSVVMRLTYGNVRFFFGGDLNAESGASLLARTGLDHIPLESEILKVPHHGSEDFDACLLKAVSPVVSIISSGDENKRTEYIHPRACFVGALGKYSRVALERPLIFITETVAFMERVGLAHIYPLTKQNKEGKVMETPNAYIKRSFGIVHVRTDGERVFVASHSGKLNQSESYAFKIDGQGKIEFVNVNKG